MNADKKEFIKKKLDNSAIKHVTAGLAAGGAAGILLEDRTYKGDPKTFDKARKRRKLKYVLAGELAGAGAGYGVYRARRKGIIKKLLRKY